MELRHAIIECPDVDLLSLERFPVGSCGDTS
ncbi:MAG: hypothetical protein QOC85_628, partial [Streptomyces sp.]|nr:hypothetical protein [Streptomyces sp.]